MTMNSSPGSAASASLPVLPAPELASMLRRSAEIVERKEFHPLLYQTMRALTAYAGEYAEGLINNSASPPVATATSHSQQPTQPSQLHGQKGDPLAAKNNAFHDVPDDVLDSSSTSGISNSAISGHRVPPTPPPPTTTTSMGGAAAAAERVLRTPAGEQLTRVAMAASGQKAESNQQQQHPTPRTPHKGVFSLKGIKKGIEKIGADVNKFVGETTTGHHHHHERSDSKDDIPFDEHAWCDEHFTRGCHCKSLKNTANFDKRNAPMPSTSNHSTGVQNQQHKVSSEKTPSNVDSSTTVVPELGNSSAKPCFQRPINPSSNLIANGWIEQQRRSKMRVVWKDVLASLVEGRRPGEETTLWIQRQVIDSATGKVTGLEALHQIPMKWLEDVNYVDIYGDHQFTLKVYNITEEFYFRTRDEQSAHSWVLTLRSARDSSLEGVTRMASGTTILGNMKAASEKNQSAKEMGLHNLDDWDTSGKQANSQGKGVPPVTESGTPPQAGAAEETKVDGSTSSFPPPNQQKEQLPAMHSSSVRMSIAELRAIAHGAGYNTRGMERQDLERIAAHLRRGSYNINPPPSATGVSVPATTSTRLDTGTHEINQSAAERIEREQALKANEEARRQKENEERMTHERMRREREELDIRRTAEKMAAEQQRQRQEIERQASDIKRRQEEDRLRRMAELQQQQARAAAEKKQRDDDEEFKRRQEEDRQRKIAAFQQQQAQAAAEKKIREEEEQRKKHQHNSSGKNIPSPPTSGGYPQNFQQQQPPQQQWQQQQQQQSYQQWQQHQYQQQHHHHHPQNFHQQGFPGQQSQPSHQQYQQQFPNQNINRQGGHQQGPQQQQPQYQNQQHQQQQRPSPSEGNHAHGASSLPSKYAKQMEEKNGELCSASTLQIKRSILINWALQPPNLNMLRPIDHLITTIHTAMPPAYGVAAHAYFAKFTPILQNEIFVSPSMGNHPDEEKLKKAVRKVRVFLHPDKLPRDLSSDQAFAARMLWDITSDSWEEFQKHKDELDWIRS